MRDNKRNQQEDIHSLSVRAGKRTYFFDVRSTKDGNLYLTITESKKKFKENGDSFYEKHKIFLYNEDFEKFTNGIGQAIDYIKSNNPTPIVESVAAPRNIDHADNTYETGTESGSENHGFTSVDFEDLDNG